MRKAQFVGVPCSWAGADAGSGTTAKPAGGMCILLDDMPKDVHVVPQSSPYPQGAKK